MDSVDAQSDSVKSVGIVGGGISGLVAAWHLISQRPELEITVYEASDRVGGKLRQEDVGGHRIDVGAESALWRRPEVVELLDQLGIEAVHPMRYPALLWSRGQLEKLPAGTLMGIPSDPQSAAGLLDEAEIERALDERPMSRLDGDDISVGDAVEMALGSAVVDRMVEPLLGGVYAGHARELSAKTTVPALYRALEAGASLTEAARVSASAVSSDDPRQVFGAPAGGMGGLPELLRRRLRDAGVEVLTGARVDSIKRSPAFKGTWHLEIDRDGLPEPVEVDGLVLAVPAPIAAQLLPDLLGSSVAKEALGEIEYASMAIISYAFPAEVAQRLPAGTGFLVPAIDGHAIKASTFSSVKWPWLGEIAPENTYVRVSLGRHRETEILERSDEELITIGLADLEKAVGFELPDPVDAHVQRWQDGLPQYAVGHAELMDTVRRSVEPLLALELAGAYCDGVGIPACVATARRAADAILQDFDRPSRGFVAASATPSRPYQRRSSTVNSENPTSQPESDGMRRPEPKHVMVERINGSLVYAMWSVFTVSKELEGDAAALAQEAQTFLDGLADKGVTVRGAYDLAGFRAEADLMLWMHSESVDALQEAYRGFLATGLGRHLTPYWSNMAMHRVAEFNKGHIPAFMADEQARKYICVYPFVRSYDWYLLPDDERKKMLHDHGMAAREYPDVRANTIASFGLGDYEWILAFEADELHRILDLMREMRYTEARRHVRHEIPFFTGPMTTMEKFASRLR